VLVGRILCLFDKHTPKRSSTHWDDVSYAAVCKSCGTKIRRLSRGKWKRDWIGKE